MDIMTIEELKILLAEYPGWHISLFMPTHRAGRDTEQDPIRFKNMLREVETRLVNKGIRSPDAGDMLRPGRRLLDDPAFWRHQSDGLAVFFTPEVFHTYRLPLQFAELMVITNRFHVKPILPLFASDGHFYILALSQNQVRLLEGTRHTVDEVDVRSLPKDMAEALQYEPFHKHLQFRTQIPSGAGGRAAAFHGHDDSDQQKDRMVRWFRKIDSELPNVLVGRGSPVVLAGVEYLFPLYARANRYPHLVETGIPGNPERLTADELHARAWAIVGPIFGQAEEEAASLYHQLADTGRTTDDVTEAVAAAHHARIDVLFVAVGTQIWGSFDQTTNGVEVHEERQQGDEDLLHLTAAQAILTGGTVYAVEPEQMPTESPVAAVLRY